MELAGRLGGEIINTDSRQVYRYMDIGTSKPSQEDRSKVPHHLIDIINPDEEFSQALYQRLAYQAIKGVHEKGKLPFLVGGTGLYVWSVLEGWNIPQVAPNPTLREELVSLAASEGPLALHNRLARSDADSAARIDPRNVRRVMRALEVMAATGRPYSQQNTKSPPSFRSIVIGLDAPRQQLYQTVDARVESMIKAGWIDEVKGLIDRGYALSLPSMSSVGYRELGQYLMGGCTLEKAVGRIKHLTHRFIRHQYNWFRLTDPRIHWQDIAELDLTFIIDEIQRFAQSNTTGEAH